jgi:hypothetical protein
MRMTKSLFFILCVIMLTTGCIYTNITSPLDTDLNNTVMGEKTGFASTYSVLWLVSWGDGGVAAASRNGGITTVNHMDVNVESVLFGLYVKTTTIVYGD